MITQFGEYALPVLISVLLGVMWKVFPHLQKDRWKALTALIVGLGFGLLSLEYVGLDWTTVNVTDYALYGVVSGLAAVGLYEVKRSINNPRE